MDSKLAWQSPVQNFYVPIPSGHYVHLNAGNLSELSGHLNSNGFNVRYCNASFEGVDGEQPSKFEVCVKTSDEPSADIKIIIDTNPTGAINKSGNEPIFLKQEFSGTPTEETSRLECVLRNFIVREKP